MTVKQLLDHIVDNNLNVTFSGGDPMYQKEVLTTLARAIKDAGKTIWCYTGYKYEELIADPSYSQLLSLIDVLVDGPYIESLRDTDLLFRGSSNQRLIDMHKTTEDNIVLWQRVEADWI